MSVWRWYDAAAPSWADMLATDFFDDGAAGDTATFEQSTTPNLFNTRPTLTAQTAEAIIWGQGYLETAQTLTGLNFSCWTARTWLVVNPVCLISEDPFDPTPEVPTEGAEYTVSVWDGAQFVAVATGALAITQQASAPEYFAVETTFAAVTTCWVRVTLNYSVGIVACEGELIADCGISDIRPQGSDTGLVCAEGAGGGTGPVENDFADSGDPTQNLVDDCGCDWVRTTLPVAGGVRAARVTTTYARRNCQVSIYYLVDGDGAYGTDSDQALGTDGDT